MNWLDGGHRRFRARLVILSYQSDYRSIEGFEEVTKSRIYVNRSDGFVFGQGQELSEHTAAKPAMLFFVMGEASVGLGDDTQEAQAGTWVHRPAAPTLTIKEKTPLVMLLVLRT